MTVGGHVAPPGITSTILEDVMLALKIIAAVVVVFGLVVVTIAGLFMRQINKNGWNN